MYKRLDIPETGDKPFTDYNKWRLKCSDDGRQIWHYLTEEETATWPQNDVDKYWIGIPLNAPTLPRATDPLSAARNGFEFYKNLQTEDGHWAGEYGGPLFLMPGLVIGSYVIGMDFAEAEKLEMIRYLMNHTNKDGGLGLHIEGHSTVFGTALNYVALRLLGMDADHPVAFRARACLHKLGGATAAPAWGKFWLSVLNVYDWSGQNSIPPELFLLPDWLPIHPHRFWIHLRNVFVSMSYIYAKRWKMPKNPLIMSLRQELYTQPYDTIDWPAQCNNVAEVDIYSPHTKFFEMIMTVFYQWEKFNGAVPGFIRRKALERVYDLVVMEDENTGYQTLGPVSKMTNQICRYMVEGRDCESYRMHMAKRRDFMWLGKEGMMMNGTNGSQLWDISFICQAMVESGLANEPRFRPSMLRALDWLDRCQIQDNPVHYERAYRHTTKGAWPFSTKEQGYTVSDCTAEGLKAVLYLQDHLDYTPTAINERRLCDAVDVMLTMQNSNGGFASYELIRGPQIIEKLNPAEVFGDIMIEYSYPECTTSVLTALSIFRKHNPTYRADDIQRVTRKAIEYIHNAQYPEGGWFGSWGICFSYATMFALESLALVGETYSNSESAKRACEFLLSKQKKDGGWGESYKSCEQAVYVQHEQSQVVQTAWAGLALMYASYPHRQPIEAAVKLIMERQLPDGSWAQEAIEGIFNKSCAISYPNFKFSFTIWFLGKAHHYLANLKA